MEDGKYPPPIELILLIPYHYVFCTYKYMIYSQIMSLNPRERAGFHPSGHPPPSLRLPLFLASFWFYPQNFISLGQNYIYV